MWVRQTRMVNHARTWLNNSSANGYQWIMALDYNYNCLACLEMSAARKPPLVQLYTNVSACCHHSVLPFTFFAALSIQSLINGTIALQHVVITFRLESAVIRSVTEGM